MFTLANRIAAIPSAKVCLSTEAYLRNACRYYRSISNKLTPHDVNANVMFFSTVPKFATQFSINTISNCAFLLASRLIRYCAKRNLRPSSLSRRWNATTPINCLRTIPWRIDAAKHLVYTRTVSQTKIIRFLRLFEHNFLNAAALIFQVNCSVYSMVTLVHHVLKSFASDWCVT